MGTGSLWKSPSNSAWHALCFAPPVNYHASMPKKDFTQVALDVVRRATVEVPREPAQKQVQQVARKVHKSAAKKAVKKD